MVSKITEKASAKLPSRSSAQGVKMLLGKILLPDLPSKRDCDIIHEREINVVAC